MPKEGLSRPALLRTAGIAATLLTTCGPALAVASDVAEAPVTGETLPSAQCGPSADTSPCEVIYVTGSRIRRLKLTSPLPITIVPGDEFFDNGRVSAGDTLNDLPQLRSTFSQSNSTRFLGTSGLSLLDLRGLGPERTLVLINGRRHAAGDVLTTGTSLDVSTIPVDLIERVEVVTGGNSAVYGSDAIAGVVNFVLRKEFEGIRLRGQSGISMYGDAGTAFVSALAGQNFAQGRGNVTIDIEYSRRNDYFASGRPWLSHADAFIPVDADPPGTPSGSDGVPDRLFFRDLRMAGFSNTGVVRFNTGECGTDALGTPYNCPFTFRPDGTLVPLTGTRVGLGPTGAFVGGNGDTFRAGDALQLAPSLRQFDATLLGHVEISPAFEPFVEATFVQNDSSGTGSNGPTAITGGSTGDPRERPMLSNPFLSAGARQLIIDQLTLQNGFAPGPNTRFAVRENFVDLPSFRETARRRTMRLLGGARGGLGGDWTYEISAGYDQLRERTRITGNMNVQRFLLAADAAVNPATGEIECRSKFNPAARIGYIDQGATLANDIEHCIPINLFAATFTQQQKDYLLLDTTSIGRTSQFDVTGYVTGSLPFLVMPGGPIGVVAGAEYRSNRLYYRQDPRVTEGYTFYNSIPTFDFPSNKVKEVFAELRVPFFKDRPWLDLLELDGAVRASDYSLGKTGTVVAYNASLQWATSRDLRFRGGFAHAIRAPNPGELFTPAGQNFAPGFTDPCSARNLGAGSSNRASNCSAAGRPTLTYDTPPYGPNGYDFSYSDTILELVLSGNRRLEAETSNSLTLGAVVTPAVIPGLSFSADYFRIVVDNVISSPGAQSIADACYDAPSLNNPFCALFQRNTAPDTIIPNPADPNSPQIIGNGPNGEYQFQIIQGSLKQVPVNYARLKARGIDFEFDYHRELARIGMLNSTLVYTHMFERSQNLDPAAPSRRDVLLTELGDPRDAFNWDVSLKRGKVTLGYQLRFVSRMLLNQYEDVHSVNGDPPQNADYASSLYYPARTYHSVRAGLDLTKKINFHGGIDNLTNTRPPFGLTGITDGGGIYDNRGRFYFAGAVLRF
ncbi:MAG TPA: TonB-dependent receptor [Sphingomicrobium sp.]|nr:TonB-dependent receptor [Sphingomicrobium sp.]